MGKIEYIVTLIIFNLFFVVFIAAILLFIRQYHLKKKEHTLQLHFQKEAHQRELLSTQIEIQQETMQHIGREIHDNIGQKLTLASLYTQQLAFENKAPNIRDSIESISDVINQSLTELRELSKSLTDNTIEKKSIIDLIESECHKIEGLKICGIQFSHLGFKEELSYELKSILLRITQEFIQNSIKHAHCTAIGITLSTHSNNIHLKLVDNGIGFDSSKITANGIGLSNMKKRTEILGGDFLLESNKKGTSLEIILNSPYEKNNSYR